MSAINRVGSQTPAIQFQPQTAPAAQQSAKAEDPFAKLNEALQALEKALQAFSGGGKGGGQDLGVSNQGAGGTGFDNNLFKGQSTFDTQPTQTTPNFWDNSALDNKGGGGGSFLDNKGSGGGNSIHTFGDKKSGGGSGGTVDPNGGRWNW